MTFQKSIIQMPAVYQGIRRQNRLGITSVRRRYAAITGRFNKANIQKGGIRKRNQAAYLVKGFRLFDKVRYDNQAGFVLAEEQTDISI